MMALLFLLLSFFSFAETPTHWSYLSGVKDRHEFYVDNDLVVIPKDSWQILFSAVYTNIELKELKDCVYFRVPGNDLGILKIKTIASNESCENSLLSPGDKEWPSVRSLQFSTKEEKITLDMTFDKFRHEKWSASLQNKFKSPEPKMHLSSGEMKTAKIIMLAPRRIKSSSQSIALPKTNSLCHEISDDCEEKKPSTCSQCAEGWYEIPNGCAQGPKYCGRELCGLKNQPACRRGMKWQRKEEKFECRTDSSFVYCAKGLVVSCQGSLAYCR